MALWRMSVLGPLISARLEHGDRQAYLEDAAARDPQRPDGRIVRVSAATVEAWLYLYRAGGFEALYPKLRADRRQSRALDPALCDLLVRAKREKPRRSLCRLILILERAGKVPKGLLSRSTVHRVLVAAGVSARPRRYEEASEVGEVRERRSFITEHAGDLAIGDVMHGPRVLGPDGRLRKSYALSQLDCATRYVPHSYFALSEGAAEQEYGLAESIRKHGRWRSYYVDRGAAYIAHSLRDICAELGIRLLHAGPGDCEAKGAIERWHERWRAEVQDELPDAPITLAELNAIHWAWLGSDYHVTVHDTTGREPKEHFLSEVSHLLPVAHGKNLDEVLLHRAKREVRKDATVRWEGGYLEVRPELMGEKVEIRWSPRDASVRPRVFVNDRFYCDTVPLDRLANATRKRRRIATGTSVTPVEPTGLDPLGDLCAQHYHRSRWVGRVDKDDGDAVSPEETDSTED